MSDNRILIASHRRCATVNYRARGIYLITLCTENHRPILGELCGDSPTRAYIRPTQLGYAVLRCWRDIPAMQHRLAQEKSHRMGINCHRNIQLIATQLMPDHFHGIIFIKDDIDIPLGQIICGFMMGCTKAYHAMIKAAYTPPMQRQGEAVSVSAYMPTNLLTPLWEKGYHDRPLRGKGQLRSMIDYVHDNPRRLFLRRHSAQFFKLHKGIQIRQYVFDAKGDISLLNRPMYAVHVRRHFAPEERRAYMNACVVAARRGAALVGAFISPWEQQVRAVALQEGHAVIQLTTDALSEQYKPSGVLFDACASGQLLILSQTADPSPFSRRITRAECNALNTIAEELGRG